MVSLSGSPMFSLPCDHSHFPIPPYLAACENHLVAFHPSARLGFPLWILIGTGLAAARPPRKNKCFLCAFLFWCGGLSILKPANPQSYDVIIPSEGRIYLLRVFAGGHGCGKDVTAMGMSGCRTLSPSRRGLNHLDWIGDSHLKAERWRLPGSPP